MSGKSYAAVFGLVVSILGFSVTVWHLLSNNRGLELTYFNVLIVTSLTIFALYYLFLLVKKNGSLLIEINKLSSAMEQSHDAVMMTSLDNIIEYVNPKFKLLTGYTSEELIGSEPKILRPLGSNDQIYNEILRTIESGNVWQGELRKKKKNDELYWASEIVSPILDTEGRITHYLSTHRDITKQYILNEKISFDASHDSLTGLANRREFERRAEQLLISATINDEKHALCFMDLDQFKVVNDTCGHAAGDELLRQLASALKKVMRQSDTLARIGGDEFGVLMEGCSIDDAHQVAKILQQNIQDYQFSWQGHYFKVGVSMGLVPITKSTINLSDLLKYADACCYMAKESGRNRIQLYSVEDEDIAERQGQMQWVERINQAFEKDQFCLYAQPIVSLGGSNNNKHYELLIRMKDDQGDLVPPGAFLPAAERYNLIGNIDRWVINKAFAMLLKFPRFLQQVSFVSINISGMSLANTDFLEFVVNELALLKVYPEKICFEITETSAISNLVVANLFISRMKQLGCLFALDDFGSGLSSFGYLKNLPVDYLKIDGMFVKDMLKDRIDFAMVKSINEIGQVMGMKTIAEFVENDEIKEVLEEMGVNFAQGYGIGKPCLFNELLLLSDEIAR